ncbi:isocitrate lyase/PEP mutase family protein [Youngiibacter multivorans]|uniref:Carboxyvinyl-carboxyphosphonate phosphorylmutase n=1 Tax=Youngiibacter multivorans TaxID=937251 RepID=A0ABS4G7X1_9CLOT|nr:oxaloacetate decarboxylase [Youngiibacter multivorans]MBP1920648.1 carboxyvinyl-carboxyphosphonate phosphorylmutase [Youngiibacter multivorans]
MQKKITLRNLLDKEGLIVAPGCHDAFGAKIIEHVGFEVAYMTGNGTSASLIGKPDLGLITASEMVTHARGIVSAVNIPIICDCDNGYGGVNNVIRAVEEYEAAGVSAIHIEDQDMPKKCAALGDIKFIAKEELTEKIKAAVHARKDKNFTIIARTDCRSALGLKEAISRGQACANAGADVVYIELLESIDEMKEVVRSIDAPVMFDMLEHFRMPYINVKELENIGYKLVVFPLSSTLTYAKSILGLMTSLKETGTTEAFLDKMLTLKEYEHLLGYDMIERREIAIRKQC